MHGHSRQAGKPLGFIRELQVRDAGTGSPVFPEGTLEVWSGTTACYYRLLTPVLSQTPPTFS